MIKMAFVHADQVGGGVENVSRFVIALYRDACFREHGI
jgi:hypothetical protein